MDINFSPWSLLLLDYCFPFFAHGKFVRTFNFVGGRVLISSSALRTVCEFISWVGHWSTAPRCCGIGCGGRGLGTFFTWAFSFMLVQIIGTKYCLEVTGVTSKTS
jgi:hypothetical protein